MEAMSKLTTAAKTGGISDVAVRNATGKTWAQWLRILDVAGAQKLTHKNIAAHLAEKYPDIGGWWSQMVTVGYEQARGMREKHKRTDGYFVSRSKTLAVPVGDVFKAWKERRRRARWLGDEAIEIRKATPDKSMRITWSDGKTSVSVHFYAKDGGKSQVTVQHEKLTSAKSAERMKAYWGERLEALKTYLTSSPVTTRPQPHKR